MQELADALAERLGAPVAIEDRRYRMLAYSAHAEAPDPVRLASILTREAPADLAAWLDANGLPDADGPVRLAPPPQLGMGPRVAVPIPGRLGYVWLVDDGRVGEDDLAAAGETAAAAADAIRARREAERTERALVGDLLRGDPGAARRLRERGLRGPVRVVAGPDLAHRRLVTGERAALFAGSDAGARGARPGPRRERAARAAGGRARRAREAELAAALRGRGRVVRWETLGPLQLLAPLAGAPVPEALGGCSRTPSWWRRSRPTWTARATRRPPPPRSSSTAPRSTTGCAGSSGSRRSTCTTATTACSCTWPSGSAALG